MKKWFAFLPTLILAHLAVAAPQVPNKALPRFVPIPLHNKLVFTRGHASTYWTDTNGETVWTMDPDGTHQKRVWRVPKGYGRFGGFNRDGTQALSYNGFNLYLNDLITRRRHLLYQHSSGWGTYIGSTSFSHDAKQVTFAAGSGAAGYLNSRVYVLNPQRPPKTMDAMEKLQVLPSENYSADIHEPQLSFDGSRLTVSTGSRHNTDPEAFSEAWDILTMKVDGSSPRRITRNPSPLENLSSLDKEPCFSPDGRFIAFVHRTFLRGKGESNDIYLVNVDGQNERRVTSYIDEAQGADAADFNERLYNRISTLSFSADGTWLAFNRMGRESGIYIINTAGKGLKRLTDGTLVQWTW